MNNIIICPNYKPVLPKPFSPRLLSGMILQTEKVTSSVFLIASWQILSSFLTQNVDEELFITQAFSSPR